MGLPEDAGCEWGRITVSEASCPRPLRRRPSSVGPASHPWVNTPLDAKNRRNVIDNLRKLQHPHPGEGIGDKEKLPVEGEMIYRLQIG